jgi:hypothetical protein
MMAECVGRTDRVREMDEWIGSLRRLLEESVVCARRGNLLRLEELGKQADAVVEKMRQRCDNLPAALGTQGRDLRRLYDQLVPMLRAEQADAHVKLAHLRQVRRAVGAYRADH